MAGFLAERSWMVLLEAVRTGEAPTVDPATAGSVLRAMGDGTAVGLHCPDRVAVQVAVSANDPAAAATTLLYRWRSVAPGLGLEEWDVVRAEAMTPEEFGLEFHDG